ncbi:MAG: DoxX family membrane protein [candidate division Zixibacteria bacterium]|nr:DoxX family membrane protein [candidate division Zixibacteria bacterium]
MRRIVDNDYLTMLFRLAVGGVFIGASVYKIIEPGDFARSIWYYHMVPGNLINLMALILPWLELVAGLCLVIGVLYRGAVIAVNGMTVIFIIALSVAIQRGIDIDCGCFKAAQASGEAAWEALIFDLVLIVLTIQLALSQSTKWRLK